MEITKDCPGRAGGRAVGTLGATFATPYEFVIIFKLEEKLKPIHGTSCDGAHL